MKKYSRILKFLIPVLLISFAIGFSYLKSSSLSKLSNLLATNPDLEFTITYNLDGGDWEMGSGIFVPPPEKFKVSEETSIPNPVKDDSEFLGWTSNELDILTPQKDLVIPKMTKKNVVLNAKWKDKKSMLLNGYYFNEKIKNLYNYSPLNLTFKRVDSLNEALSKSNVDVSENGDKSIVAYYESSDRTIYVVSENIIVANEDCSYMFQGDFYKYTPLNYIYFDNFDTSNIKTVNGMFNQTNLKSIDFADWNTPNLTDISYMFSKCKNLQDIKNISNINTEKCLNFNGVFYNCVSLEEIDLSKLNMTNAEAFSATFSGCVSLKNIIGLSNIDMQKVKDTSSMFNGCTNLSGEITIKNPEPENYLDMFLSCSIDSNAKFIVKYIDDETKEVARQMVATKSSNSNVYLWDESMDQATLMQGEALNSKFKNYTSKNNIQYIKFEKIDSIDEIKNEYSVANVSEDQSGSILMYYDNIDTLHIVSEKTIMANIKSSFMFGELTNIKEIYFDNFDTSNVINFMSFFAECSSLENIDLSNFNTENAINVSQFFSGCKSLTKIDLRTLDFSQSRDFSSMFSGCSSAKEIILPNKISSILYNTSHMFYECSSLENLDLSMLSNKNIENMRYMFYNCVKLKSIKSIPSVNNTFCDMRAMFYNCQSLSGEILVSTNSVKDYYYMFEGCSTEQNTKFIVKYADDKIKNLAQNMVDTKSSNSNVYLWDESMEKSTLLQGQYFNSAIKSIYYYADTVSLKFQKVESLDYALSKTHKEDVSEAKDKSIIAYYEESDKTIYVVSENKIMANKNCIDMFKGMNTIKNISFENFNTSNVEWMINMFYDCSSLINLNLSSFDTSNLTSAGSMFYDCSNLTSLDLSNFNTSNVTHMGSMFLGCSNLTSLDLSNFDTSNVEYINGMFLDCEKLSGEITIKKHGATPDSYKDMFLRCSTDPNSKFIVKYVDDESENLARQMVETKSTNSNVYLYENNTLINASLFKTKLKSLKGYSEARIINFSRVDSIDEFLLESDFVDVSENQDNSIIAYYKSNVINIVSEQEIFAPKYCDYLFADLYGIESITFENFKTNNTVSLSAMFTNCRMLKSIDLSNFDTSNITSISSIFYGCENMENINLENLDLSKVESLANTFHSCKKLLGEITIRSSSNIKNYENMFYLCSTDVNAEFIINYVDNNTKEVAMNMVSTKADNSKVFLGELVTE